MEKSLDAEDFCQKKKKKKALPILSGGMKFYLGFLRLYISYLESRETTQIFTLV